MGIQSGSPYIRSEIFHRYETQEDIINATKILAEEGIFWTTYDFMLCHSFETVETIKETYELVKQLYPPFELQLHGLNFLPGTDIVKMAIDAGYYTEEEMNAIMYAPMREQFGAYWQRECEDEMSLWYMMIYLLQYKSTRSKIEKFEMDVGSHKNEIVELYNKALKLDKLRYFYKKSRIVLKRVSKG